MKNSAHSCMNILWNLHFKIYVRFEFCRTVISHLCTSSKGILYITYYIHTYIPTPISRRILYTRLRIIYGIFISKLTYKSNLVKL